MGSWVEGEDHQKLRFIAKDLPRSPKSTSNTSKTLKFLNILLVTFFQRHHVMWKTKYWTSSPSPPVTSAKLHLQHCIGNLDQTRVLILPGIQGETEDGESLSLSKM